MLGTLLLFGPNIEVGPLAGLAFWSVLLLGVLAALGAVTLGGALVFIGLGALVVVTVYFIARRILGRLAGRR
jgi:hypothetical protein